MTNQTNAALARDINNLMKTDLGSLGMEIVLKEEDNLNALCVKLFNFPEDSELHEDLQKLSDKFVLLEMEFDGYPFKPPFVRVISPRFKIHTGHVTVGGSICIDVLTSHGWSPALDIEKVLVIIKTTLTDGKGRIDHQNTSKYTKTEAHEAFKRVLEIHEKQWQKA